MDKYTNTQKLPRQGTDAYKLGRNASAKDVRPGMVVPKSGNAKGGMTPDAGTATHRGGVPQASLGPAFRVLVKRGGYDQTNANIQANGKIMPATTGSRQNFWAAGKYGPLG